MPQLCVEHRFTSAAVNSMGQGASELTASLRPNASWSSSMTCWAWLLSITCSLAIATTNLSLGTRPPQTGTLGPRRVALFGAANQ